MESFPCQKQGHVLQIGSLQYSREEKCHNLRKALSVSVSPPSAIWSVFCRMNEQGPLDHLCVVCSWRIIIKLMYASQEKRFPQCKVVYYLAYTYTGCKRETLFTYNSFKQCYVLMSCWTQRFLSKKCWSLNVYQHVWISVSLSSNIDA